ncbi:MAG: right-handed parallel beta-helix repeat-containing protein [Christensenella sp.]|nr:right-handed parallel beta-helix repeat-containing protein [Christensenella sp.]
MDKKKRCIKRRGCLVAKKYLRKSTLTLLLCCLMIFQVYPVSTFATALSPLANATGTGTAAAENDPNPADQTAAQSPISDQPAASFSTSAPDAQIDPSGYAAESNQQNITFFDQTLSQDTADGRRVLVTGMLPEGAQLKVQEVNFAEAQRLACKATGKNIATVYFAYDITIYVGETEYQPVDFGQSVCVRIENVTLRAEDEFALLHIEENETAEEISIQSAKNDSLAFMTDSFSFYIGVNSRITLPGEIWYNGTNFYSDAACSSVINDAAGIPFTNMQEIINHINGDLTIYMKAGYVVKEAQAITGGTAYQVILKRFDDSAGTSPAYTDSLITVQAGTLTLCNIIIDGGAVWTGETNKALGRGTTNSGVTASLPLISVASGSTLTLADGAVLQNNCLAGTGHDGGAVKTNGAVFLSGGLIKDCSADQGGGVYVSSTGSFTINKGTISGNSCTRTNYGGGGIFTAGSLTMNGGTIEHNHASFDGGGIYTQSASETQISGGIIRDNTAAQRGGGVFCFYHSAALRLGGGQITGNTATYGGGIALEARTDEGSRLTMEGGVVTGNTAATSGGGIYMMDSTAVCTISGGAVLANTALNESDIDNDNSPGSLTITGGSIQSVSGVTPASGQQTPAAVYLNTIKMDGTAEGSAVTALNSTLLADAYGLTDVLTDANGKIYIWLPENSVTTSSTVADRDYFGTITSLADNTAQTTFSANPSVWTSQGWYDTSWYLGHEADAAYTLYDAQDLAGLAVLVNGTDASMIAGEYLDTRLGMTIATGAVQLTGQTAHTFEGKTITLANNIRLNEGELSTASRGWTSIGSYTDAQNYKSFSGTFDGQSYAIDGLYINAVGTDYLGLFACVGQTGEIRDLSVSGKITVQSNQRYLGGIAGSNNGSISNCHMRGSMNGYGYCAGIVGSNSGSITNCFNDASITASRAVGGICGYNAGSIKGCGNAGKLSVDATVGGICGTQTASGIMQSCKNTASITATTTGSVYAGGILGNSAGIIQNCYNTGSIITSGTNCVGGIVGKSENAVQNCYNTGSVTAQNNGGIVGINASSVESCYSRSGSASSPIVGYTISGGASSNCGVFTNATGGLALSGSGSLVYGTNLLTALNGWVDANIASTTDLLYWSVVANLNGGFPVFTVQAPLQGSWSDVGNYDTSWYLTQSGNVKPQPKGGYVISTPEQLAGFSVMCRGKDSSGTGYYVTEDGTTTPIASSPKYNTIYSFYQNTIILANNITLNSGDVTPLSRTFSPIGATGFGFAGVFDGQGHSIEGLYIPNASDMTGLFPTLAGISVELKNLHVSGKIYGHDMTGGIVGRCSNGKITNCSSSCEVSGSSYVGGIVGYCGPLSSLQAGGMVQNCNFSGSVNGIADVGGIVGLSERYLVQNCYNTGSVSGTSMVGGIVGRNYRQSITANCYSTGSVTGITSVGGVVGRNWLVNELSSTIENCAFLSVENGVNASLYAVGTNDAICAIRSCASFADNAGALTASGATVNNGIYEEALLYGNVLLTSLNSWIDTNHTTYSGLTNWAVIDGTNNGYPVFNIIPAPNPPQTLSYTLYAYDEDATPAAEQNKSVTIDLAELFGSMGVIRGKNIHITANTVSESVPGTKDFILEDFHTVYAQRRNTGYSTANTHFGVSAQLSGSTATDVSGDLGTGRDLGAVASTAADATLTLTLYNHNALTQSGGTGTLALTVSDGTNVHYINLAINRAAAQVSATVPITVTSVVKADGNFIFPQGTSYSIKNYSAFPLSLASVSWAWSGDPTPGSETGIYAKVASVPGMTATLGFKQGDTTYSFNTQNTVRSISDGYILASNGILPGTLPLWWDITLGSNNYFKNVWEDTLKIATVIYTVGIADALPSQG